MTVPTSTRRHDARAMGTTISLYGPDVAGFDDAAHLVMETFRVEERRFSRFRGDSELSRVNETAGHGPASPRVRCAARLRTRPSGRHRRAFDPTVLDAMEAAGYDRDFDEVIEAARGALHPPVACGRWREIDVLAGFVRLPNDVGLDLGGVAKGWTVDLATEAALGAGLPWLLVSAGGDLRIAGDAPELEIDRGGPGRARARVRHACACVRRPRHVVDASGGPGAPGLHHVIDPTTGAPADAPLEPGDRLGADLRRGGGRSTVALLEGAPHRRTGRACRR